MRAALAALLVALTSCGTGAPSAAGLDGHHARAISGALGRASPVSTLLGLFVVPARVGETATSLLVDTGAPVSFVAPGLGLSPGPGRVASLEVGALTLFDVPAIGGDPFGLAPAVGGVLGANVLCQFVTTFDWRARRLTLGEPPSDEGLAPEAITTPFSLVGGGALRWSEIEVPVAPTRIVVDAEVEGVVRRLVLDTGASTSALRADLVDELARDRRSALLRVTTQDGVLTQRLVRARGVSTLGMTRDAPTFVGFDLAALRDVSREVGAQVDGLLGVDVLAPYRLTIDYPSGRLTLRRYLDTSHVRDRWVRAGIIAGRQGGRWRALSVLPGSDAEAQGVREGATLVSIDGRSTTEATLDEVDAMLVGSIGEFRRILTPEAEYRVRVEDVVPLP